MAAFFQQVLDLTDVQEAQGKQQEKDKEGEKEEEETSPEFPFFLKKKTFHRLVHTNFIRTGFLPSKVLRVGLNGRENT